MTKRLFVHAGFPATGTTTIQHSFHGEREMLLTRGLLYPESCIARPEVGHHNIYWEASGNPLFDPHNGRLADLHAEIRRLEPDRVLISSEVLVNLIAELPDYFRDAFVDSLHQYQLTVVVAVRRIDHYIESSFRQQFGQWIWGRAVRRSTDIGEFLAGYDVERALAPLRALLDSDYDVAYLPFGPKMLERFSRVLGLNDRLIAQLATHGAYNQRWMSHRAMAVVHHLARRADEEQLRLHSARNLAAFQDILASLGPPERVPLLPAEHANRALARAEPVYREIGDAFADAIVGDRGPAHYEHATIEMALSKGERARIEEFFGAPVLSDFDPHREL